jgi:hypothetical protein
MQGEQGIRRRSEGFRPMLALVCAKPQLDTLCDRSAPLPDSARFHQDFEKRPSLLGFGQIEDGRPREVQPFAGAAESSAVCALAVFTARLLDGIGASRKRSVPQSFPEASPCRCVHRE